MIKEKRELSEKIENIAGFVDSGARYFEEFGRGIAVQADFVERIRFEHRCFVRAVLVHPPATAQSVHSCQSSAPAPY